MELMQQKLVLVFIAGAIVGGALVLLYEHVNDIVPMLGSSATSSTTNSHFPSTNGALAVSNQAAGDTVTVDSVTVPPPGVWVAVVEVMPDGSLGNVLGAALARGPRSNVSVQLLRATLPGHNYAVELYRDDGNGTFVLGQDSVYIDFDTGQRVVAPFSTTAQ